MFYFSYFCKTDNCWLSFKTYSKNIRQKVTKDFLKIAEVLQDDDTGCYHKIKQTQTLYVLIFSQKKKLSNVRSFLQDNLSGLKKIIEACKPFITIYFVESFILDLTGFHTLVSVVSVSKFRYRYIYYITYQFRFLWNKKDHCWRSSILGFYIQVLEIQIKKGKSFLFTVLLW